MKVRKSKPYKLAQMFESSHLENIARAQRLISDAKELIHQSNVLMEDTKATVAASKQRKGKQASKQASIAGSPGHLPMQVILERA